MPALFFQSDKRWSSDVLGHGPSTIGRAGCVLVSLTMAADRIGRGLVTPPGANDLCRRGDAFRHFRDGEWRRADLLYVPRAALALGFIAPPDDVTEAVPGHPALPTALANALGRGLALVRVDHTGDERGDHTILATSIDTVKGVVHCLDPAIGPMTLAWPSLSATVMWRDKEKTYRVTKVQPLRRTEH